MAKNIFLIFFSLFLGACSQSSNSDQENPIPTSPVPGPGTPPEVPYTSQKVWGVTLDSITNLGEIITSLQSLNRRATTRIVFDEFVPATYYKNATVQIAAVSDVMGELLDSFYVKDYSLEQYKQRTVEYLDTLQDNVDIWEIGNEINGEWLGDIPSVVAKMTAAYDIVKQSKKTAALTLYYNEDCWKYSSEEMFSWAQNNVPERMKQGLDYVFISYYEDDCNGLQPNWPEVFEKVGKIFPNSKIGFGEVGTSAAAKKEAYLKRYYTLEINHPRFVGGYFWWYFKQDMVPNTKPLWSTLNSVLSGN